MPSKKEISKPVKRSSARFRPIHVAKDSTSARRSLFGPADHEENAHGLAELCDQLNEQAKIRWNFDFLNCTPLLGRYEWIRPKATDNREPAASTDDDDVNDRVNDAASGVKMVETVNEDDSETAVCDKISPSLAESSSSPNNEQTISSSTKRQSMKRLRRLTWAPKKKIGFLSRSSKRSLREVTMPDYYPVRKRLEF